MLLATTTTMHLFISPAFNPRCIFPLIYHFSPSTANLLMTLMKIPFSESHAKKLPFNATKSYYIIKLRRVSRALSRTSHDLWRTDVTRQPCMKVLPTQLSDALTYEAEALKDGCSVFRGDRVISTGIYFYFYFLMWSYFASNE